MFLKIPPVFIFSSVGLREIDIETATDVCHLGFIGIPGYKWCTNCRKEFGTKQTALPADESDKSESAHEVSKFEHDWSFQEAHSSLNSTLEDLELTPLKLHGISSHSKVKYGKRNLEQVNTEVTKKIATALKLDPEHLVTNQKNLELKSKAADSDHLVEEIKKKLETATRQQKVQILILTPKSWSLRHAAKDFNVSRDK